MRRERRSHFIIAVVIVTCLTLGGIAEAGGLLALDGPMTLRPAVGEEIGLLDQGASWLAGLWSDFKAVFSEETSGSEPANPAECPPNTTCGDAGPGIDPEG